MEPRFSYDFSRVKVHSDKLAAESAQAVGAKAYTVGRDIVFGAHQYAPSTNAGQKLLAHELIALEPVLIINFAIFLASRYFSFSRWVKEKSGATGDQEGERRLPIRGFRSSGHFR